MPWGGGKAAWGSEAGWGWSLTRGQHVNYHARHMSPCVTAPSSPPAPCPPPRDNLMQVVVIADLSNTNVVINNAILNGIK